MSTPSSRRHLSGITALIGVGVLLLSGCTPAMTDEEMFTHAREVNFAFKAAISEVQLQLADEEWRTAGEYGDAPNTSGCPAGQYAFSMRRSVPPIETGDPTGWRLPAEPEEMAERISAWLYANGWTDILHRTYTGDIHDLVVHTKKPDAHVASLEIDFSPGESFDSIVIRARSTCQPGDSHTIIEMLLPYPPDSEIEYLPATEHPRDTPSFGYTVDGKPRFWPDENAENG